MSIRSNVVPELQTALDENSWEQLAQSFHVLEQQIQALLSETDDYHPLDVKRLQEHLAALTYQLHTLPPSNDLKGRFETFDHKLSSLLEEFSLKAQMMQQELIRDNRRQQGIQAYHQNQRTSLGERT